MKEWRWEIAAVVIAFGIGVLLGIALPAGDTSPSPAPIVVIVDRSQPRPVMPSGGIVQVGRV